MVTSHQIKITKEIKNKLDSLKIHPRETYNDVLTRMIKKNAQKMDKPA